MYGLRAEILLVAQEQKPLAFEFSAIIDSKNQVSRIKFGADLLFVHSAGQLE